MNEKRSRITSVASIACLLFVVCFGLYVAGYFMLGTKFQLNWDPCDAVCRKYEYKWLVTVYKPMAALETTLTGVDVCLMAATDQF